MRTESIGSIPGGSSHAFEKNQDEKKPADAQAGNGPQQPTEIEACSTEDRMDGVTDFALQPVPAHTVIRFDMTDDRLDRLATFEHSALATIHGFDPAAVNHLHRRYFAIYPTVTEINDGSVRSGRSRQVLQQDGGLLQLGV